MMPTSRMAKEELAEFSADVHCICGVRFQATGTKDVVEEALDNFRQQHSGEGHEQGLGGILRGRGWEDWVE